MARRRVVGSSTVGLVAILAAASLAGDANGQANTTEAGSSRPTEFVQTLDTSWFAANDGVSGMELWQWDAAGGARLAVNVFPDTSGLRSSFPAQLTLPSFPVFSRIYFVATDPTFGRELRIWDGSLLQTADVWPGASGSVPNDVTAVGNEIFFTARSSPSSGRRLFQVVGGGAQPVAAAAGLEDPYSLTAFGGRLLFGARSAGVTEAWSLDVVGGTGVVALQPSGLDVFVDPGEFAATLFGVWFPATEQGSGERRLAYLDITGAVDSVSFGPFTDVHPDQLVPGLVSIACRARTGSGPQLHSVSASSAQRVSFLPAADAASITDVTFGVDQGGSAERFWFTARDGGGDHELYTWATGTSRVQALPRVAAGGESFPRGLISEPGQGSVLFAARDGDGVELWRADATTVTKVSDVRAGPKGSYPSALVGGFPRILFSARASRGRELYDLSSGVPAESDLNTIAPLRSELHIEPDGESPDTVRFTIQGQPGDNQFLFVSTAPNAPFVLPPGLLRGFFLIGAFVGGSGLPPLTTGPTGVDEFPVTIGRYSGPCGQPMPLSSQLLTVPPSLAPPFDLTAVAALVRGCAIVGNARVETLGFYDDETREYRVRAERSPDPDEPYYLAVVRRDGSNGELLLEDCVSIGSGETTWIQGEMDLRLPISAADGVGDRLLIYFLASPPTPLLLQFLSPLALAWFSYC